MLNKYNEIEVQYRPISALILKVIISNINRKYEIKQNQNATI